MSPNFPDWRLVRRTLDHEWSGKRLRLREQDSEGMTRQEFFRFRHRLLEGSIRQIRTKTFEPAVARPFTIFVDKPRVVFRFRWIDHFWMDYLGFLLRDKAEEILSDAVVSFRTGRGVHTAFERLRPLFADPSRGDLFVLRRDVQNYGPSMDHRRMQNIFRSIVPSAPLLEHLFSKFCSFQYLEGEQCVVNASGLPAGSQLQTAFDNLYLHELDHQLDKMDDAVYVRFGDDILFATTSLQRALDAKRRISEFFLAAQLVPNEKKCQDFVITRTVKKSTSQKEFTPAQIFPYLGMLIDMRGDAYLPRQKMKKITTFLKAQLKMALGPSAGSGDKNVGFEAIQVVKHVLGGGLLSGENPLLHYLPLMRNEKQLRALDRWIATAVISAVHGGGFKKSFFRSTSFSELREMGLPSLVHMRRVGNRQR